MKGVRWLAHTVTIINKWVFSVCTVVVFLMAAFICVEVCARYAFNAPTVWAMELSTMLFGPYFMLSGAYLLHMHGHVNVDILSSRFGAFARKLSHVVIYLTIAILCALFIWQSLPLAIEAYRSGETSFTSWNPVVWPVKITIPISLGLVMLQALAELYYSVYPLKAHSV